MRLDLYNRYIRRRFCTGGFYRTTLLDRSLQPAAIHCLWKPLQSFISMGSRSEKTCLSFFIALHLSQHSRLLPRGRVLTLAGRGRAGAAAGGGSWSDLGLPDWLVERAEQYGFLFPTGASRRQRPCLPAPQRRLFASPYPAGQAAPQRPIPNLHIYSLHPMGVNLSIVSRSAHDSVTLSGPCPRV